MLYNRLITNRHRAAHARDIGAAFDESRCSGRSTAIALDAVAKAIRNPQQWIEVVDHYERARPIHHVGLAQQAMAIAGALNLMYFERDRNLIRSCHMTPTNWSLSDPIPVCYRFTP